MQDHKSKKPTKAQLIESIPNAMKSELNKNFILNMIQGSDLAYQMMLDYINSGHTLDEVKSFIEKNLSKEGRESIEKIANMKSNLN